MKLTFKEKAAYGLGAIGKDMVYMLSASYILYYYQDIMGVSAIVMGIILMIARVFDAFNDPFMGVIVAKTKTKWGKFRPWLFIGTLTNAVVLYLMFAAPPSLSASGLVAYAAIFYILWGVTYTMMDIPYWSMVPAFTESGKEREGISAMARSCAGVGSAIISVVTVLSVAALGNMASANSADTIQKQFTNNVVYCLEQDETATVTGKMKKLSASSITITADKSEFASAFSLNQDNSEFELTVGNKTYTNSDTKIDLAVDDAESGQLYIAIYLSSEDYATISDSDDNLTFVSGNISSKKSVERLGFKYFSLIIAVVFFLFILVTCVCIKEKSTVDVETASVKDMFKALFSNDQAMVVVVSIVLINCALYITSNLVIYFFKYDFGGADWKGSYTLFTTFGGGMQILAMMFVFPLLRKFMSTIKVCFVSLWMEMLGYVILLGLTFTNMSNVYILFAPAFFIFAGSGVLSVLTTVFLANTVDYGQIKNGRRDESVIFSMQTFVVKLSSGVAALIASICLSVFKISDSSAALSAVDGSYIKGFTNLMETIAKNGATVVSNSSVVGLRMTMTIIPVIGLVVAFFYFKKHYILTEEKVEEISAQIKAGK